MLQTTSNKKRREKESPAILTNGYLLSITSKIFLLVISSEILFIANLAYNNTGTNLLDILICEPDVDIPFFIPLTLRQIAYTRAVVLKFTMSLRDILLYACF